MLCGVEYHFVAKWEGWKNMYSFVECITGIDGIRN